MACIPLVDECKNYTNNENVHKLKRLASFYSHKNSFPEHRYRQPFLFKVVNEKYCHQSVSLTWGKVINWNSIWTSGDYENKVID